LILREIADAECRPLEVIVFRQKADNLPDA